MQNRTVYLLAALLWSVNLSGSRAQTSNRVATVDLEIQVISFLKKDIAAALLANEGGRTDETVLRDLKKKGHAVVLHAPRLRTSAGVQAQVKAVNEIIYPTDWTCDNGGAHPVTMFAQPEPKEPKDPAAPQPPTVTSSLVGASNFETREAGLIVNVTPRLSDVPGRILLSLVFESCELTGWKTYPGRFFPAGNGPSSEVSLEQPIFFVQSVTTEGTLENGKTAIVGGGIPTNDGERMVYLFVTATLVNERTEAAPPPGK